MGLKPRISKEQLEQFRKSGIRLDGNGRFWHEGHEVTHPRMRLAFLKWLDRLPNGRPVLRLDETRFVYLEVEEAELEVKSILWEGDCPMAKLNDDSLEPLACDTLFSGASKNKDALFCKVRNTRLLARFSPKAQSQLARAIFEQKGEPFLKANGCSHPIATGDFPART